MKVTRRCPFTKEVNTLEIPGLTQDMIDRWQAGGLIQNVMPNLTADEREFIMTGITSKVWEELFKKDEEIVGLPGEELHDTGAENYMEDPDMDDQPDCI